MMPEEKYIKLHEANLSMLGDFLFSRGFGFHTKDVLMKCVISYYYSHYADVIEMGIKDEIERRCKAYKIQEGIK